MSNWISVNDSLPEDRDEPYQVIAALKKKNSGLYEGTYARKFVQDWNVRRWPENFIAWQYDSLGHVFHDDIKKEKE